MSPPRSPRLAGLLCLSLLALGACTPGGRLRNPFVQAPPFAPTAVPSDFAIVVDEQHNTFYTRQHIQQVITAADALSRTTYTNYRELTNTPSERYSQETPLTPSQVQAMWNTVSRNELMQGAVLGIVFHADADLYRENTYTLQIRANGHTISYRQVNGFPAPVRPLVLLVNAVRLPMSRDVKTPVIEGVPTEEPVIPGNAQPAATQPTPPSMPAPAPATTPQP